MLFRSTYPRVPGSRTHSQNTGIAPMCRLTAISTAVSWLAQPGCGPWRSSQDAISPGGCPSRWMSAAPDMPPEDRGAVVAATGVAAGQVPAVLPEPVPQGGLAGRGQCVRADPHHPAAVIAADLAVFEEEVDTAAGAVTGPAVPQPPRAAEPGQQPVELARSCLA